MFKPIHYLTESAFNAALANNSISSDALVFIKDKNIIYTHGTKYNCFSDSDIDAINNLVDAVSNHVNDTDVHVTTSDKTYWNNKTKVTLNIW